MHTYKKINFMFSIVAPEHEYGNLLCTVRSIKNNYPETKFICIVPSKIDSDDFKEIGQYCPAFKGRDTITSLLNTAMKKGGKEWNMIIMEGTPVRWGLERRYSLFIEDEKDVLFPIVTEYDRQGMPSRIRSSFEDASLNGMFIHQNTFKQVGDFTDAPIPVSKFIWEMNAHQIGCRFKGILGAKLL